MKFEGTWTIQQVLGKKKTDKQSGIKITFSQPDEELTSETVKTAIAIERFGKLSLTGKGAGMELQGKLMERKIFVNEDDKKGEHVLNFVPAVRLEADEFTALYMAIDEAVEVVFEDDQKSMEFEKAVDVA